MPLHCDTCYAECTSVVVHSDIEEVELMCELCFERETANGLKGMVLYSLVPVVKK